jgi:hypothetical protein
MYFFAPVSIWILERWPKMHRASSVVGLVLVVLAMVASSFAIEVWHLILTQGVLYAVGGSLLYTPTAFYLDQWFIKRKGTAFGIMWAGVGTYVYPASLPIINADNTVLDLSSPFFSLLSSINMDSAPPSASGLSRCFYFVAP